MDKYVCLSFFSFPVLSVPVLLPFSPSEKQLCHLLKKKRLNENTGPGFVLSPSVMKIFFIKNIKGNMSEDLTDLYLHVTS